MHDEPPAGLELLAFVVQASGMYSENRSNLIQGCVVLSESVRAIVDRPQDVKGFLVIHAYTMHPMHPKSLSAKAIPKLATFHTENEVLDFLTLL